MLTHTLLDNLIVNVIFNPHLINFWEAVLNIGVKGRILVTNKQSAKSNKTISMMQRSDSTKLEMPLPSTSSLSPKSYFNKRINPNARRRESFYNIIVPDESENARKYYKSGSYANHQQNETTTQTSNKINIDCNNADESLSSENEIRDIYKLDHDTDIRTASKFDKIRVPIEFVGRKFQDVFQMLLRNDGIITLALYRRKLNAWNQLPYVILLPNQNTDILIEDEIFILRS